MDNPLQNWLMTVLKRILMVKDTTPSWCGMREFLFVCLLQDASGHSNVLRAGKAEELKNARKRRTARKAN